MIVVINVVKKIKIKIPKDKRFKRFCLTKTEALDVGEAMNRTDEYLESCTSLTGKLNELSHTCFPLDCIERFGVRPQMPPSSQSQRLRYRK